MAHPALARTGETVKDHLEALQVTGQRREIVDEFGTLSATKASWAPFEKRLDELRTEISGWYGDLPADQSAIAHGTAYDIQISQRTTIKYWTSMRRICKAAGGIAPFLEICTVTFKALSGVIGNTAAEALQSETQSGHRKLVAVPKSLVTAIFPHTGA